MDFNNKTVLLTGASSGIGYSLAKLLPKENCSIALLSRRENILNDLANEIKIVGGQVRAYKCDVGNVEEVRNSFEQVRKDFGKIDVAILNAGASSRTDVSKYSSSTAIEIFKANTFGIINCVEQLLPDFMQRREGVIVGVSSLAESRGFPKSGFYNASKAAATLLLESLRVELKPYNIKVMIVKPGFVKTPMTDKNEFHMPFLMNVDKAAKIILDGIKKEKRIIQFPLTTVIGSKLVKFMPDWLFDFLMSKELPARKN
ncbi:MAG TPA: SDR family NAD(P)-dependent oxidoreductase [Ignavibacteriaceae bacterium]|nr:SDR family NAD(P)-dependent oxidoreductase [Ignavibacteriaceae bacterium]